jgi:ankyrin repeat protein
MVKRGMDVEVRGKDGWTPLLVAATAGHVKAAEELIAAKANINSLGDNGETALIVACASGQKDMAQVRTYDL